MSTTYLHIGTLPSKFRFCVKDVPVGVRSTAGDQGIITNVGICSDRQISGFLIVIIFRHFVDSISGHYVIYLGIAQQTEVKMVIKRVVGVRETPDFGAAQGHRLTPKLFTAS